jgi:hypothetical protein
VLDDTFKQTWITQIVLDDTFKQTCLPKVVLDDVFEQSWIIQTVLDDTLDEIYVEEVYARYSQQVAPIEFSRSPWSGAYVEQKASRFVSWGCEPGTLVLLR